MREEASEAMQASSGAGRGLTNRLRSLLRRAAHLEPVDPEGWYVILDTEFHGPISREVLAEVLAEHTHDEDAPLWSASHAEEWTTMREVPGLADEVRVWRERIRAQGAHPSHPPERAAFASSGSEPPPAPESVHSGEIDVAAALRSMNAKNAPVRKELLAGQGRARSEPSRRRPHASPRERSAWIGTGVALGALAVVAFGTPFVGPARRPLPAPPPDDLTPCQVVVEPPTAVYPPPPAADPVPAAPRTEEAVAVVPPASALPSASAVAARRRAPSRDAVAPVGVAPVVVPEAAAPSAAPAPAEAPPQPRSLDELLAAAVPVLPAHAPPATVVELRTLPSDAEVVRALDAVRSDVVACTPTHAVAALRLTLDGPSGRVSGVYVDGVFAGTAAGSCIARAVRRAHVAPFAERSFAFSYPYRL